MKKPIWLRLVGWLDLALWLFWFVFMFEIQQGHTGATYAFAVVFFGVPAFALFCVWAIASAIAWGFNRQARVSAAVMRDAIRQTGGQRLTSPLMPTAKAAPRAVPGTVVPVCSECKNPSVLHCCKHEINLCWQHLQRHDSDECTYIQSTRVVPSSLRSQDARQIAH